ncbi:MAG: hypothetical protein ACI9KS_001179 [Sulfitobacter sp.]|jgi:hypothetical protein
MARLASGLWVSAYLARLQAEAIPVYITAKGDATAGAVLVKLATLDGQAVVWQRSFDLMTGDRTWVVLSEGEERAVDDVIMRQRATDPDLWVIEVESRSGTTLLDQPGLAD